MNRLFVLTAPRIFRNSLCNLKPTVDLSLRVNSLTTLTIKGPHSDLQQTNRSNHNFKVKALLVKGNKSKKPILLKTNQNQIFLYRGISSESGNKHQDGNSESGNKREAGYVNIPFWGRLAIVTGIVGLFAYTIYQAEQDKDIKAEQVRYSEFKNFGGDWKLIDMHGKERSSTEFRGQWILMYFGFLHCPDICPEELEKLTNVIKKIDDDPNMPPILPIFVTNDPERDSPASIKEYLAEFKCPRLLGFTGDPAVIKNVAKSYRSYYGKGEVDQDGDYIIDHTIITYLISPNGEFVNYFDRSVSADAIVKTVTNHIDKYKILKKRGKL